jgi:hypothetical protein
MKARSLFLLTRVLALFVVAPGAAVAKRGGTDRPIQGSGVSTTTTNLATTTATTRGTAVISHLGRNAVTENDTATVIGPGTITYTGAATFAAANGDRLYATVLASGTFTGLGVGESADYAAVYTITGGTGRFADAGGTLTVPIHSEYISLIGATLTSSDSFRLQGRISY